MKYKFGEMDSKKIVKRTSVTLGIFILLPIVMEICSIMIKSGITGKMAALGFMSYIYIIIIILKPILIVILLILGGEGLYKILKAAQIVIEKEKNN
ncbi:hypothetical protein [Clostridium sp.]|uniref:hypothetical protein n=1 Tax=Clostridium sp. TaxID=1506 RepID=UPI002FC86C1B